MLQDNPFWIAHAAVKLHGRLLLNGGATKWTRLCSRPGKGSQENIKRIQTGSSSSRKYGRRCPGDESWNRAEVFVTSDPIDWPPANDVSDTSTKLHKRTDVHIDFAPLFIIFAGGRSVAIVNPGVVTRSLRRPISIHNWFTKSRLVVKALCHDLSVN